MEFIFKNYLDTSSERANLDPDDLPSIFSAVDRYLILFLFCEQKISMSQIKDDFLVSQRDQNPESQKLVVWTLDPESFSQRKEE